MTPRRDAEGFWLAMAALLLCFMGLAFCEDQCRKRTCPPGMHARRVAHVCQCITEPTP